MVCVMERPSTEKAAVSATARRASGKARSRTGPSERLAVTTAARSAARRGGEQLAVALAAGLSVSEAAQRAGLSERTVYRRLHGAKFQRRLAATRNELITRALGELAASASHAVSTIGELLDSSDERVRLQAARALLDQLLRLRDAVTLDPSRPEPSRLMPVLLKRVRAGFSRF